MIKQIQLKQKSTILNITASHFENTFFIFLNSLGKGHIPTLGDEIISENCHFKITQITPIITGKHNLDNYAIDVEKI